MWWCEEETSAKLDWSSEVQVVTSPSLEHMLHILQIPSQPRLDSLLLSFSCLTGEFGVVVHVQANCSNVTSYDKL